MVLSRNAILAAIKRKDIAITPFEEKNVGAVSVDLRLGDRLRVFVRERKTFTIEEAAYFSPSFQKNTKLVKIGKEGYLLKPGHMVLGTTLERIRLCGKIRGELEGRSRFARMGLMVHISSSLVQPGVDNVQVLEILNASPFSLVLKPGERVCQILFERVEGAAEYSGKFKRQLTA